MLFPVGVYILTWPSKCQSELIWVATGLVQLILTSGTNQGGRTNNLAFQVPDPIKGLLQAPSYYQSTMSGVKGGAGSWSCVCGVTFDVQFEREGGRGSQQFWNPQWV